MAKAAVGLCALGLAVGMLVGGAGARQEALAADAVVIAVSPSTISLGSKGGVVSVHADIPFSVVDCTTLDLSGLPAQSAFADDRGDLVVKVSLERVKAIIAPPSATLTLTGATKDGVPFTGTDTIRVVEGK
ncbi:MAG TPA: hypothetical protein VNE39_12975 [Planctomycetota bacterium]|nr:hypothetical protein [Planctomycetota bacterium]